MSRLGKAAGSALRVHEHLQQHVIVSIPRIAAATGLTVPTVTAALRRVGDLGIVREITGKSWGRQYVYQRLLDILNRTAEEQLR